MEDLIKQLIAALNRCAAAQEAINAKVGAGKAAPAATVAAAPAAASTSKPKAAGKAAAKVPTEDDVRNAFGGYMSAAEKGAARDARKAEVGAMIAHYGVDRISNVPEDKRAEALGFLKMLEKGEVPPYAEPEAGEEGETEDEDEGLV